LGVYYIFVHIKIKTKKMKNKLLLAAGLLVGSMSAQTVFLNEDFESGSLPTGWSQTTSSTDGGYNFGTAASLSSQYFAIPDNGSKIAATNDDGCNCDKSNDVLETKTIDLSTQTTVFVSMDYYYFDALYQGAQEELYLTASTDGGTTWSNVQKLAAASWGTAYIDVSAFAGSGNTNVKFGIDYNDGSGWTYGAAIDNFKVFVPYAKDFMATEIDLYETQGLNTAPFTISGEVMNVGSSTINNFTVNYQINGAGMVFSDNVTSASVGPFTATSFSHATAWTPSAVGMYDIAVWCSPLDGSNDQNTMNDTIHKMINVVSAVVPRTTLIETFTSSTCPPCVPANSNLEALYNDASNTGRFTSLKYQVSWPGNGDPYYTDEAGVRRTFYNVTGVPNMELDGGWGQNGNSLTQDIMNSYQAVPSMASIDAKFALAGPNNKVVKVSIDINAVENLPGTGYTLHTAIFENKTVQNVGSNGETEFFHVMKKMLPDASGKSVGNLIKGQQYTAAYSYTFQGNFRKPNSANDPINHSMEHSVEEFTDLGVLVWLQDAQGNIEQSAYATESTISISENDFDSRLQVYPNPTSGVINISLAMDETSKVEINVINSLGQVVLNDVQSTDGEISLDLSNLPTGLYSVQVGVDNNVATEMISLVK
jgi:hypothetical protein